MTVSEFDVDQIRQILRGYAVSSRSFEEILTELGELRLNVAQARASKGAHGAGDERGHGGGRGAADVSGGADPMSAARYLARELREAKSTHLWTNKECDLLATLCAVLGVK